MPIALPILGIVLLLAVVMASGGKGSASKPTGSGIPGSSKPTVRKRFTGRLKSDIVTFDVVDGVVKQSPMEVTDQISKAFGRAMGLTTTALATMMASEVSGPESAKLGVAWAAKNKAKKAGGSLFALLTTSNATFASQRAGRYAATSRPPSRRDVELAEGVLSGKMVDPTGGALQFDSPASQRVLLALNHPDYRKGPEAVAADRRAAGLKEFYLPDVSPDKLRFWKPASA